MPEPGNSSRVVLRGPISPRWRAASGLGRVTVRSKVGSRPQPSGRPPSSASRPSRGEPTRGSRAKLAVAFVLVATTATAQEWSRSPAVGLGPLLLRPQSPLSLLRYSPTPMPPVTLRPGEWRVGTVVNWNNYFAYDPGRYVIDVETVGLTLGATYGVSERFDASVSLPVTYRGGGVLDGFIEGFEESLGVPNEKRELRPRDDYLITITGRDGSRLERRGGEAGWGLEDADLALRYQITPGSETRPAVLVGVGAKIPVGRRASLRSTGGVDVATGIAVAQKLGRFHFYGTAAITYYGREEMAGIRLAHTQRSLFGGVEYRVSPRTSWVLQGVRASAGAVDFGAFSKATHEVTLGIKRVVTPDLIFEMSLLENLFVFDNSPDVGVHVGLVWRSPH